MAHLGVCGHVGRGLYHASKASWVYRAAPESAITVPTGLQD